MKLFKKFLECWYKISENKRNVILESLSVILNYFVNGVLLAVPIQIILFFITNFSFKFYPLLVIAISILLAFFEHYYIFIKQGWKKQL